MARKYDRYGLNRQFKAKPCSKRHPFPHKLPFVDDYSLANEAEKVAADPYSPSWPSGTPGMYYPPTTGKKPSKEEILEAQRKKRATNVARKLAFEHPMTEMKKHQLTRRERRMNAAFYYVAGAILTGGVAGEIPAVVSGIRRTARVVRKMRYVVERWNRYNFGGRAHMD